jgi:hypothetical protein
MRVCQINLVVRRTSFPAMTDPSLATINRRVIRWRGELPHDLSPNLDVILGTRQGVSGGRHPYEMFFGGSEI